MCEYDPNDPSVEAIAGGPGQTYNNMATNNLMNELGGQSQPGEENSDGNVSCYGSSVSLKDSLNLLLKRAKIIVDSVGGNIEEALSGSFILMRPDCAVHPRLQQGDQNIITYSVTLSSKYLIENCAMFPSLGRNILPHIQLRGKENVATLRRVLK